MDTSTVLPHVTAALNVLALALLLIGYVQIRTGRKARHRAVMLSAVGVSAVFLAVYVVYHLTAPIFVFRGPAEVRPFYYALLISHVVLAAVSVPVIAVTLARALAGRFQPHRAIARWTFPLWVYVSASGVLVYALLYHVYNPGA